MTEQEEQIVALFEHRLGEGWEIYVHPFLNGIQPTIVLLHPRAGMAMFEVVGGREGTRYENAIHKVNRVKNEILGLYCSRLGAKLLQDRRAAAVVTAGVVDLSRTTREALGHFELERARFRHLDSRNLRYFPVVGYDSICSGRLADIFPEGVRKSSMFMTREIYLDLRSWLVEPDHDQAQRRPLEFNDRQRELVHSRTETGYRRIKGPAGSGKSQVLAARASVLSAEGRDVLVACYNITLWHYLRDLSIRFPNPARSINSRVTWIHFHQWCCDLLSEAGLKNGTPDDESDDGESQYFEEQLPTLAERALEITGRSYDAILVDEGQDFSPRWWKLLRKALRPNGEALLAADLAQDLYGRGKAWTDDAMREAGFRGRWVELEASYRLPPPLVPLLQKFVREFLPSTSAVPQSSEEELNLWPFNTQWIQVAGRESLPQVVAKVVMDTPSMDPDGTTPFSDVVLLTQTHELGEACVAPIERAGVKVHHIFDEDEARQRKRKMAFYMSDSRIKASTVKSFKGWEGRSLVVVVNDASDAEALAEAYVALSRVKRSTKGSRLTIICSAPELIEFGKGWPNFIVIA